MSKRGYTKQELVAGVASDKDKTRDRLAAIYDQTFTADDVASGWITAVRLRVIDGQMNEKLAKELQEEAAELTSLYAFNRISKPVSKGDLQ